MGLGVFLSLLYSHTTLSQISPPALGETNTASWIALGLRHRLDTLTEGGWQSMSYVGLGRKSNPDNHNPVYKPGIFILSQEFEHQLRNHWKYALGMSYRNQKEYEEQSPYQMLQTRQELRIQGRLAYTYRFPYSRLKLSPQIRQDLRRFFSSASFNKEEVFQARTRMRLQLTLALDKEKVHQLIANSEQLFSTSKYSSQKVFSDFKYKESRFCFYYSLSPKKMPVTFDVGYMNNLVGITDRYSGHYFAMDVIVRR
mgnify:CR=1 FL=1